jgi:hypothetical protein
MIKPTVVEIVQIGSRWAPIALRRLRAADCEQDIIL